MAIGTVTVDAVRANRLLDEAPGTGHEDRPSATGDELLEVRDLTIAAGSMPRPLVDGVSFTVRPGETTGIVGESGSGKSITCLSLVSLLPPGLKVVGGSVRFEKQELVGLRERQLRSVRGSRIGFVFQDPTATLNPSLSVGEQVEEGIRLHTNLRGRAAKERAVWWLDRVGIAGARTRYKARPAEFSGGMRQRVMIAIALSTEPQLLIADEPTTALDVTIQAQVLNLVKELQRETGTALLLVTHDLGVASAMCDRINVMYAGQLVEHGPAKAVLGDARHPYTRGLLRSVPGLAPGATAPVGIAGSPPRAGAAFDGCRFYDRCDRREDVCRSSPVELRLVSEERSARCLFAGGEGDRTP
jgi:peptide/nickel transport system ATP-binding protein